MSSLGTSCSSLLLREISDFYLFELVSRAERVGRAKLRLGSDAASVLAARFVATLFHFHQAQFARQVNLPAGRSARLLQLDKSITTTPNYDNELLAARAIVTMPIG